MLTSIQRLTSMVLRAIDHVSDPPPPECRVPERPDAERLLRERQAWWRLRC
jgi:hypothetical protein